MKILIIGGTKFLGWHLADVISDTDVKVTLFNRGNSYAAEEISDVERIHGDRNTDLEKLSGRTWDAVIDTCGYLPQTVGKSAEFLKDKVGQYVFISSGAVYADTRQANYDESAETATLSEKQRKEIAKIDVAGEINAYMLGENYGALKVLCEEAAEKAMPGRVLNVRAGMIVGKFDWTDRFAYWVMRVARGGEVLAPGSPDNPVQMIDARNLSNWIFRMIKNWEFGTYNATSFPYELTFGKMLGEIKRASKSDAAFTWVGEKFLLENNVKPWSDMPFYLPESDENTRNFMTMNVDKALAKGLEFRSLNETIIDVLNWREKQDFEMKAGISTEREKELLEKWHEQNSG